MPVDIGISFLGTSDFLSPAESYLSDFHICEHPEIDNARDPKYR
jgi:hypothetical protein